MSPGIVSSVVLSVATRTHDSVGVAIARRARQAEAEMLQMIDETTRAGQQAAQSAPTHAVDKRA